MMLFASRFNIDGTVHRLVKLVDNGDGWIDAWTYENRRPALVGSAMAARIVTNPAGDVAVVDENGTVWQGYSGGCGCGDPLKAFEPPSRADTAAWAAATTPIPTA